MNIVPRDFKDQKVCILGLGYVGLTLAVAMAEVGYQVAGVEIRDDVVHALRRGESHFHEPGIESRLKRVIGSGRLTVHNEIPDQRASVYIITVGTPLSARGEVRLDMISHVAEEIAAVLKDGDMVVMRSTVELGTTRRIVMPILDKTTRCYDLVFCPERTLEGRALRELRELPQIVGGASAQARIRAAQFFQFLTPTVVQVTSLETAELIKLVDNAQRDVLFGLSNEVARIADAIGVSAIEVIEAGKRGYPRTNLAMPGPVGGPCLEKDPYILASGLKPYDLQPEIILAARRLNERQPTETVDMLGKLCGRIGGFPDAPIITLAGLAFKGRPETDDLRGTMALPILQALRTEFPKGRFRGFDAVVPPSQIRDRFGIEPAGGLEAAFAGAHITVIANNHPCFEKIPLTHAADSMARPAVIFDFWNNFSEAEPEMPEGVIYTGLGLIGRELLRQERRA